MAQNLRYRESDGATIVTGSTEDLGQIVSSPSAVVIADTMKLCVENISDRALGAGSFSALLLKHTQVGSNDAINFVQTALDPNGTLSKPWGAAVDESDVLTGGPTAVDAGGPYGVWGATGTYGVVATAVNANGETIASVETTFDVTDTSHEWTFTVLGPADAVTIRWYVTDTPGTYGAYALVHEGASLTFTYDGTAPSVGTPPDDNTTGGAAPYYGDDPDDGDFDTSDKTIATSGGGGLAVGQQWFFYLRVRLLAGTTRLGNKRQMQLAPTETA